MTLVRLLARRNRLQIGSWTLLLVALAGATISAYQSTYPTPEQRRVATELARDSAATTMMYGRLADPGTPAQMFAWEVGAIATILASVMAVLLTVSVTRAAEDDGTLELVRATGVDPRTPLRCAQALLAAVSGVVALGCTAAVMLSVGRVDGITPSGATAFGCVVGLTFLLVAMVSAVLAQVAPTAAGARALGLATVGAAFALRAFADVRDAAWLNWLSPLGLRATVRPFSGERWWVLLAGLGVTAAVAALAGRLAVRREFGGGLVPRRDRRDARLTVRSGFGLAARLARRSVLTWTVAVAAIGTLITAIGAGAVRQSQEGDLGGFLGAQVGAGDPVAGYFAYSGTVVALMVCSYAILSVLRAAHDESGGFTDLVLTTGARRWAPLAWQVAITALGAAAVLVTTGALSAVVAPAVVDGPDVAPRAFAYVVGQWPAAMVTAGFAALLVGLRPRLTFLAWVPLVASGLLALLGDLLGVPPAVQDLGILRHVPDVAVDPDPRALLVLVTVAAVAGLAGVVGTTRRDLTLG